VVRIFTGFAVLVFLGVIAHQLAGVAMTHPRFQVRSDTLVSEITPRWLPDSLAQQLREDLRGLPTVSIFDPALESKLVAGLSQSPWVGEVRRIERIFPDRVRVDLSLRRPVAACNVGEVRVLLDEDGRALARESVRKPTAFPYDVLHIEGVKLDQPPAAGDLCGQEGVRAGVLAAAELLAHESLWRDRVPDVRVRAVDVARRGRTEAAPDGEVFLRTRSQVLIRWGRPAKAETYGILEPPVAAKIDNLARVNELYPGLRGLDEVWVGFDQPSYRPMVVGKKDDPPMIVVPRKGQGGVPVDS